MHKTPQNKTISNGVNLKSSYHTITHSQYADRKNNEPKLKSYSKGDSVILFGYNITNSIFYTCNHKSNAPFAIDTKSNPNFNSFPAKRLGYWPNYNQISREQQGYFIKWLANGKPYIEELGYAYIYYYGLEYRALIEKKDLKEVLFEVIELVNKFSELRYGYDLIVYLTLSIKDFSPHEASYILTFFKSHEQVYMFNKAYNSIISNLSPTFQIKFYPCNFLNDDEYYNLSNRKSELLSYYFNKATEKLDKTELYTTKSQTYSYHLAMMYYYTDFSSTIRFTNVSYEAIIPSSKTRRIWNRGYEAIKIIQPIKKFDSSSDPLTEIEKLTYLPQELRKDINYSINDFDFCEKSISDIETIAYKLGFDIQDRMTLRQSIMIANACEALGYEIEPDANFVQKPYRKDSKVIIYKNPYPYEFCLNNYNAATLFTDIGYQIALEDKELLLIEIAYIKNYVEKEFHLPPSKMYRLQMRGELIVYTKEINTQETVKKLIKLTDDNGREAIAKYLISVAMADGIVKDSELRILQKIFKQLDFSEDYLNSTLSKLVDDSVDKVVVIKKAETTVKKGSKIPKYIEPEETIELKLNKEKLEKIKINTSEIHNVLQEIFADEQADIILSETNEDISADDVDNGSESNLSNLINLIIEKDHWTRNELFNIIQNRGMMLNSVIDEINELTEEQYGDFLIDEDENIYLVNTDVVNLIKNKES